MTGISVYSEFHEMLQPCCNRLKIKKAPYSEGLDFIKWELLGSNQ